MLVKLLDVVVMVVMVVVAFCVAKRIGTTELGQNENLFGIKSSSKRTTPGIPTWSPTVVLTRPDDA